MPKLPSFESLDPTALNKLAKKFITEKNYDALQILISSNKHTSQAPGIYEAIRLLDIEAVSIIVPPIKIGHQYLNSMIDSWIQYVFDMSARDRIGTSIMEWNKPKVLEAQGQLLKEFTTLKIRNINELNKQNKEDNKIDKLTLGILAQYLNKQDFNKYLSDREIDLTTLDLSATDRSFIPSLLFQEAQPLIPSIPSKASTEVLLAKTYTKDLAESEILSVYNNLATWDTTKILIDYVAATIVAGRPLKIIFTEGASYYQANHNLICIGTDAKKGLLTTESITAHEFAHYVMDEIFDNNCLPFNYSDLYNAVYDCKKLAMPYCEGLKPENIAAILQKTQSLLELGYKYDIAAQDMLKLASELIKVEPALEPYNTSEEMIKYLAHSTILPIFYLSACDKFTEEVTRKLDKAIDTDPKIQTIMIETVIQLLKQPFLYPDYHQELAAPDKTSVLNCMLNKCLPRIISELQLTEELVGFLERIGDIIFRPSSEERYVEFIVRYPEHGIMNYIKELNDPRIMASFDKMKAFWKEHILPQLNKKIKEGQFGETSEILAESLIAVDLAGVEVTNIPIDYALSA